MIRQALVFAAVALLAQAAASADDVIDPLAYPTDVSARAAWKAMDGSAEVSAAEMGGTKCLKMPCSFRGTAIDRGNWDFAVKLDLASARGIKFRLWCGDISSISHFRLYLHSGGGWYSAAFGPSGRDAWSAVTIDKAATGTEGAPGGWSRVDTLRISAWRGGSEDQVFYIAGLEAVRSPASVLIVRNEGAATNAAAEMGSVCQFAGSMAQRLDELGIGYSLVSDLDLTAARLKEAALVILPHDPAMSPAAVAALEGYLNGGGKLLAFYSLPDRLQKATGLSSNEWVGEKYSGFFARIVNTAGALKPIAGPLNMADVAANMPRETAQRSWNIRVAKAEPGRSVTIAEWKDAEGKDTGYAAIVASANAMLMSHVMVDDDLPNKRLLLMSLAGHLAPDLWRQAAQASVERMGRMGTHKEIAEAKSGPGAALAIQAEADRAAALASMKAGRFAEALSLAERGRAEVMKSWAMAEVPEPRETRLIWCHSPLGPALGSAASDWDASARLLADSGFTGVIVNVAWAGAAAYDSAVLPRMAGIDGDPVTKCVESCRKNGLACHLWKVNWCLGSRASKEFMGRMKREGRTQMTPDGKGIDDWLCPSNPENRKMDVDSMVELAMKYRPDGIHFDYIRYPGSEGCFCPGCRTRFEKVLGHAVAHWPKDVLSGPDRAKWLDFRRDNISAVVAAVSEKVRQAAPGVKMSAAVYPNYPVDRDTVGQDWSLWCEKGWLDFVCPMDYTPNNARFQSLIEGQRQWAGKAPYYPGIGLDTWEGRDLFMLFDQIRLTRRAHTGGFTVFECSSPSARDIVPLLGLGITKKQPPAPRRPGE